MNSELPPKMEDDESKIEFEKKEYKKNIDLYVFSHVAVAVDTTGKNYQELPELYFGTFDNELDKDALNKPNVRREGVDLNYVAKCIEVVARESGIHEFWFYPFGDDVKDENKDKREQARLRLFKTLGDISPAPIGYGYVLKI
jgi:hypothetical protein